MITKFFSPDVNAQNFINWYYALENDVRREEIENRIQKQITVPEAKFQSNHKAVRDTSHFVFHCLKKNR